MNNAKFNQEGITITGKFDVEKNVYIHQEVPNLIIVNYPENVNLNMLEAIFNRIDKLNLLNFDKSEPFILINNGTNFKSRPSAEVNHFTKSRTKDLENLHHIIFVAEQVPLFVKIGIKFTVGLFMRNKYTVVSCLDDAIAKARSLNKKIIE